MARQRKVIRSKRIYTKRRFPKKAVSRILFFLLILLVAAIGFVAMNELNKRYGGNNESSSEPSSEVSSEASSSVSEIVSSVVETPKTSLAIGKARFVSADTILANANTLPSLFASYKQEGYESVAVELKPVSGVLIYNTQNAMAAEYRAVAEHPIELETILAAAEQNSMKAVAAISTLRDQTAPHVSRGNSYAYGDSTDINWLDNSIALGGKPWLNPYMDNTRKYICDLVLEINRAGFDTILLENVMFPNRYTEQMNTLKTHPSREIILGELVTAVKATVPEATVYASFDAEQLAENGSFYINSISTTLAPIISANVIEAYLANLGEDFDLSGEGLTVEAIAKVILGNHFVTSQSEGELLPILHMDEYERFADILSDKTDYILY